MTEPYIVADGELKPWELRIRRFGERHPALVERIDREMETDAWFGAAVMVAIGVVPPLLLAAVSLVLALTVDGLWVGPTVAFTFTGLFFAFAACVVWREDHT